MKIILVVSLVLNIALGAWIYSYTTQRAEEASGIKDFQYNVDCNTVFGYEVCTSDFVGLSENEAIYKAKTHGLTPVINFVDGKAVRGYILEDQEPFRINFTLENDTVTEASFH